MNITDIKNEETKLKNKTIRRTRFVLSICGSACAMMIALQIAFPEILLRLDKNILSIIFGNEILYILLNMALFVIYLVVPFGLAELILRRKRNKSFYVKKESSTPKAPPLYVFGAIGVGYLINFIVNLFFRSWVEGYSSEGFIPTSVAGIILFFIFQSVFPAIIEEWAFRGVILKNLLPYGKKGAIFMSSLFFGIAHTDPPRIIFATAFGIILAICYEKTGSLKIPMLIHFLNNAIATIATVSAVYESLFVLYAILNLLTMVLLLCGAGAIVFYAIVGISKKKYSLNKPFNLGYSLTFGNYVNVSVLNIGILLYLIVFSIYFRMVY